MAALALIFFAVLSLNLPLAFALGIKEPIKKEQPSLIQMCYPWIIIFVSTFFLWVFLARILFFLGGDISFLLVFPLSVLTGFGLEKIFFRFFSRFTGIKENQAVFSSVSSFYGLAAAAALLTLHFALSFADAFLLSLAFSTGGFLAFFIIKEIQNRSFLEDLPYSLRGTPILFVSMGLLALVFSAASVLFLKIFL